MIKLVAGCLYGPGNKERDWKFPPNNAVYDGLVLKHTKNTNTSVPLQLRFRKYDTLTLVSNLFKPTQIKYGLVSGINLIGSVSMNSYTSSLNTIQNVKRKLLK